MDRRTLKLSLFVTLACTTALFGWIGSARADGEQGNCAYFNPVQSAARTQRLLNPHAASALTVEVTGKLASAKTGRRLTVAELAGSDTIDRHIFDTLAAAKVAPAAPCTDGEFIRRVTLDLTGRIPAPERIEAFVNDKAADKRAKLIDELLAKPEWVDKWTMFFGGVLRNFSNPGFGVARGENSRDAFYKWIQEALRNGKPYNQWATELLTSLGEDSTAQGNLNWLTGTLTFAALRVGVLQENYDQQALLAAENFLGMSHMDCILCHDGAGHLDDISLWGRQATRLDAWGMASFFSRTDVAQAGGGGMGGPPQQTGLYAVRENTERANRDYFLDDVGLGNRPARRPVEGVNEVKPRYPFNGKSPAAGENYRAALARELTTDKLFALNLVNRLWKEFFVIGLVDPVNELDPLRLDPDNPPPAPWSLQASHPRLLVELAQEFVDAKYDVKWFMRQLANARAYQLSARYNGTWNAEWERLYARKLVRRLWAEEMHDALADSSGILPAYQINKLPPINRAMQFPETFGMPVATVRFGQMGVQLPPPDPPDPLAYVTNFLDSFLRGNNAGNVRNGEARINQALELFNNKFVLDRVKAGNPDGLLAKSLALADEQLVNKLFYAVLSRPPSDGERSLALANLKKGARTEQAENLLWALYNKADFIYNY